MKLFRVYHEKTKKMENTEERIEDVKRENEGSCNQDFRKRKGNKVEGISEEIKADNFPELLKNINI